MVAARRTRKPEESASLGGFVRLVEKTSAWKTKENSPGTSRFYAARAFRIVPPVSIPFPSIPLAVLSRPIVSRSK